jgi:hypothetical protein
MSQPMTAHDTMMATDEAMEAVAEVATVVEAVAAMDAEAVEEGAADDGETVKVFNFGCLGCFVESLAWSCGVCNGLMSL